MQSTLYLTQCSCLLGALKARETRVSRCGSDYYGLDLLRSAGLSDHRIFSCRSVCGLELGVGLCRDTRIDIFGCDSVPVLENHKNGRADFLLDAADRIG